MSNPSIHRGNLPAAVILILAGALFLMNNVGFIPLGHLFHLYWPSIFILIGLVQVAMNRQSALGGGLFLILLGAFLQGVKLGWFSWNWHMYWPALLILVGLWILFKPRKGVSGGWGGGKPVTENRIDTFCLFSGSEQHIHAEDFSGGEATVLFGGIKIDLRSASTRQSEIRLSVTVLFGGMEIIVPSSWRVVTRVTPILGGVEVKRRPPAIPLPDNAPVLQIDGTVMFGGLEIKE